MIYEIYGYKNGREIIEHPNYIEVLNEITTIIESCPVFYFQGKSEKNPVLDVSQIFINKYFDNKFSVQGDWDYHPVMIEGSGLAADYRKSHNGKHFQVEVQFGNMSRWYSDVFKFQLANINNFTDIGISIVPKNTLATRVDSNVTNFERCTRELPHIHHLLHLPLLIIGVDVDEDRTVDLWETNFTQVVENRELIETFDDLNEDQRNRLVKVYKYLQNSNRCRKVIYGVINNLGINTIDDGTEMIELPTR